jgi:STE24 endopeptidase
MGLGLTVALGFPVIAMIVGIVRWGGPFFYFYVWSFLFVVSILLMTIYPTLIAPMFNKYTKLDKGSSSSLFSLTLFFSYLCLTFFPSLSLFYSNSLSLSIYLNLSISLGPIYEAIETLAKSVSFPLSNIFLVDGSKRSAHSNAYFYG